jgi:hypothetical protein
MNSRHTGQFYLPDLSWRYLIINFFPFPTLFCVQPVCLCSQSSLCVECLPGHVHIGCGVPLSPQSFLFSLQQNEFFFRTQKIMVIFSYLEKLLLRFTLSPKLGCKSFKNQGSNLFHFTSPMPFSPRPHSQCVLHKYLLDGYSNTIHNKSRMRREWS